MCGHFSQILRHAHQQILGMFLKVNRKLLGTQVTIQLLNVRKIRIQNEKFCFHFMAQNYLDLLLECNLSAFI